MTHEQLEMSKNLYCVKVEYGGCEHCGAGKRWTAVGPNNTAVDISFENQVDADEFCDMLNRAAEEGRSAEHWDATRIAID